MALNNVPTDKVVEAIRRVIESTKAEDKDQLLQEVDAMTERQRWCCSTTLNCFWSGQFSSDLGWQSDIEWRLKGLGLSERLAFVVAYTRKEIREALTPKE